MAIYVPIISIRLSSYHFPIIKNRAEVCRVRPTPRQSDAPVDISWSFPPTGCIKINTDGSFMLNSGLAGFGGVARDDQGRWLGSFCGRLGFVATSSLTAELWAIHSGLSLAKKYNMKKVIIETDSSNALMLLSVRSAVDSHPNRVVIEECRRLLSELGIAMMHTLRQGNNCACNKTKTS
ncbi:hypothetical protein P3S68_025321 [Capsicum galapagoense]